jgi:hypothetical protein
MDLWAYHGGVRMDFSQPRNQILWGEINPMNKKLADAGAKPVGSFKYGDGKKPVTEIPWSQLKSLTDPYTRCEIKT